MINKNIITFLLISDKKYVKVKAKQLEPSDFELDVVAFFVFQFCRRYIWRPILKRLREQQRVLLLH